MNPRAGSTRDGDTVELEPFVDTLGDYGLVTPRTPNVLTPAATNQPWFSQPVNQQVNQMTRGGMSHTGLHPTGRPTNGPDPRHPTGRPTNGPKVTSKSGEEANAYLKMKPKGLVVLVMDGCGFCTKLKSELPKLKTDHPVTLVDAKDIKALPKNLHANGFPTLHFFDGDKGLVKTHSGYLPAEKLDTLIGEILD